MERKSKITELLGLEETYKDQKDKIKKIKANQKDCFRAWWQMLKMGCNCCKQAIYLQKILIPG